MSETLNFSIPLAYGFGWCYRQEPGEGGVPKFTYRYIPTGLWSPVHPQVVSRINRAAQIYPTYADYPPNLIAAEIPEEADRFTEAGLQFFKSCPLYATLEALPEAITLKLHNPDGSLSFEARVGEQLPRLLEAALGNTPVDHWARIAFEPWAQYFEEHPTRGFWPAHLQAAEVDSDDWHTPDPDTNRSTVPRVNAWEKIVPPFGLFKTLYFSINPDMVSVARQVVLSEGYEILNAAMAYRQTGSDEFQWREHPVWKITAPAQYVGRQIKWLEDNDFISTQAWAVKLVRPVNRVPEVQVRFNPLGGGGWDIAAVILEPFETMDLSQRVQIENDVLRFDPEYPGTD